MIRDAIGNKFKTFYPGDYGIEIETESYEEYEIPQSFFWDVPRYTEGPQKGEPKPEGSLRNFGQEYVLRVPVPYDQVPEALKDFKGMMKSADANLIKDSISTSVHVHKNALNESFQTVANLLVTYTLVENILMDFAGEFRKHNLFCLPICDTPVIHSNIKEMMLGASKYKYNGWFQNAEDVKYGALNLSALGHYGSLEFRQLSGDPDVKRIQKWIDILEALVRFSRQDITPADILYFYKIQGVEFLKTILGGFDLPLENHEELVVRKRNLWYAGEIAYCIPEDQWRKLDVLPPKPVITDEDYEVAAPHVYGLSFKMCSPGHMEHLRMWIEENYDFVQKMKKNKKGAKKLAENQVLNYMDHFALQPPQPMDHWNVVPPAPAAPMAIGHPVNWQQLKPKKIIKKVAHPDDYLGWAEENPYLGEPE